LAFFITACFRVALVIRSPFPAHHSTAIRTLRRKERAAIQLRNRPFRLVFFFPAPANLRRWPEEDWENLKRLPLFDSFRFECS
jgi:hypothetical protein